SQRYEWAAPGITPQIDNPMLQGLPYVEAGAERWIEELSAGRPIHGLVATFPPGERAVLEAQDILSLAAVPIFVGNRWWGFLGFDDCVRERAWSAAEIETLRSAAGILGAAFARCEVEEAEHRQRLMAEALRDTAFSLASTLSLDELLDRILANAQRVVPSDAATVMLAEGNVARVMRTRGYAERGVEALGLAVVFSIDETPNLRFMATSRQPSVIQDTANDPNWRQLPGLEWIRAYLGIPLVVEDQVVGFLNLDFSEPNAVPADAPELLRAFAAQAAVALANVRLYRTMEYYAAQVRQLALDLLHAQEAERRFVARELHDELGQALTALIFNLKSLERVLKSGAVALNDVARRALAEALQLAEQTAKRTRELSLDLRPSLLDELGLVPALRWYLDRYAARASLSVNFRVVGRERSLHPDVALAAYRIVQEATTNVLRHAQASQVSVKLRWQPNWLHLEISDNGQGFDVEAALNPAAGRGSGLLGMQERAGLLGGHLEIAAQRGRGTKITARLPLTVDSSRLSVGGKALQ
ncbi:MAG: GAF domain-containing protein, partial [Anaerolineae bacterium]|nr:GAF domain-containing protein [Anaerolineae bacterium]